MTSSIRPGSELEFIMEQIAALHRELAKLAFVILFVGAVLGIVGIEACWRYFRACGSICLANEQSAFLGRLRGWGCYRARREYSAPHLTRRLLITMQNSQASGTGDPARRAT